MTWRELQAVEQRVAGYVRAHFEVRADGAPCQLSSRAQQVTRHHDEAYVVLPFAVDCDETDVRALEVHYSLFLEHNPTHCGLLVVEGQLLIVAIFLPLAFVLRRSWF